MKSVKVGTDVGDHILNIPREPKIFQLRIQDGHQNSKWPPTTIEILQKYMLSTYSGVNFFSAYNSCAMCPI